LAELFEGRIGQQFDSGLGLLGLGGFGWLGHFFCSGKVDIQTVCIYYTNIQTVCMYITKGTQIQQKKELP
jgi:hypothetical protein